MGVIFKGDLHHLRLTLFIVCVNFQLDFIFINKKKKEDVYREETTFCNSREGLESLEYAERK